MQDAKNKYIVVVQQNLVTVNIIKLTLSEINLSITTLAAFTALSKKIKATRKSKPKSQV